MLVSRTLTLRVIWAVWAVLAAAMLLGLLRYTQRVDLPVEVAAARGGPDIVRLKSGASPAIGPGWPDDPTAYIVRAVDGITVSHPWHIRLALAGQRRGETVRLRLVEGATGEPWPGGEVTARLVRGWRTGDLVTLSLIGLLTLGLSAFLLDRRSHHPAAIPLAFALAIIGGAITLDEFGVPLGSGLPDSEGDDIHIL